MSVESLNAIDAICELMRPVLGETASARAARLDSASRACLSAMELPGLDGHDIAIFERKFYEIESLLIGVAA